MHSDLPTPTLTHSSHTPLSSHYPKIQAAAGWEDDREVLAWMAEHRGIEERIQAAGRARVAQQVCTLRCPLRLRHMHVHVACVLFCFSQIKWLTHQ